jgi:hypothetical protein
VAITTESKVEDEHEAGPVEKVSSALADISNALTQVPIIRPFAVASHMIFSGVSHLSAIFGWSRPTDGIEVMRVRPCAFQNGAHGIAIDTQKRLCIDPKQELTIDPRVVGIEKDELVIQELCKRESYLTTFEWAPTDTPSGATIWSCTVNPCLTTYWIDSLNSKVYQQPSPMAMVAQMFNFWRGDIVFRFDIVCSNFHRGKLAVFFEPNIAQFALIDTNLEYNKNYMKIVDIQETQSFEVCVKWAFARAWAETVTSQRCYLNYDPMNTTDVLESNGYVGVVPFTSLQSPDDSSIQVNVFVRGEDMHFAYPTNKNMPTAREIYTESKTELEIKSVECFELNESSANTDHIHLLHFGEAIPTLRLILRRFVHSNQLDVLAGLTGEVLNFNLPVIPAPEPAYGDTTSDPTFFSLLRYAFLGLRGGIKKRIFVVGESDFGRADSRAAVFLGSVSSSITPSSAFGAGILGSQPNGTVAFVPLTNGGIETEIPMITNNLFLFSFADDLVGNGNTVNDDRKLGQEIFCFLQWNSHNQCGCWRRLCDCRRFFLSTF